MTTRPAIPTLRWLTPAASLVLLAAAGAWFGVVAVADDMGSMPGTMRVGFFVPEIAPGLDHVPHTGRMRGM